MYWSRVKTILIVLFLMVNIFLFANITISINKELYIDKEAISNTVEVLGKNGIYVPINIISNRIDSLDVKDAVNIAADPNAFATAILGASAYTVTNDGDSNVYTLGSKRLTINGGSFEYTDNAPNQKLEVNEQNAPAQVKKQLSQMKIEADKSNIISTAATANGYEVKLQGKVDKRPIFEANIKAVIGQRGIYSIKGYWVNIISRNLVFNPGNNQIRHITGILVDLIKNPDRQPGAELKLTGIELGYSLGKDFNSKNHKIISAFPVYKIVADNGKSFLYDARTGNYLGK